MVSTQIGIQKYSLLSWRIYVPLNFHFKINSYCTIPNACITTFLLTERQNELNLVKLFAVMFGFYV